MLDDQCKCECGHMWHVLCGHWDMWGWWDVVNLPRQLFTISSPHPNQQQEWQAHFITEEMACKTYKIDAHNNMFLHVVIMF